MGYRTEVALAILAKEIIKNRELLKLCIEYSDEIETKSYDDIHILFRFGSLKWYDNEPGTFAFKVEDFLSSIDDDHYRIVKIGEDLTDIEIGGDSDAFSLGVARDINYESGKEIDLKTLEAKKNVKTDVLPHCEEAILAELKEAHNELRSDQAKQKQD